MQCYTLFFYCMAVIMYCPLSCIVASYSLGLCEDANVNQLRKRMSSGSQGVRDVKPKYQVSEVNMSLSGKQVHKVLLLPSELFVAVLQ